ncbi:MAG: transglutaminase-like domain-containing protein [Bacteroidales bacterium]
MKKLLLIPVLFLFLACIHTSCDSYSDNEIDSLIAEGEYHDATTAIKLKIATDSLSPDEIYALLFRIEIMERIRKDFTKDRATVLAYIKEYYPAVTDEEIAAWEASGALEYKMIDGVKKYFYNAPRNLFRISKEAQAHWKEINGRQSDSLDKFLGNYIPRVIASAQPAQSAQQAYARQFAQATQPLKAAPPIPGSPYEHFTMPVTMKIKYSITVKPNEVPAGEIIRVWMPYPRNAAQQKNITLLGTSQPEYIISPDTYPHKSLYMEQKAVKDSAATFCYQLSYTSYNHWFDFKPEDIKPYNKNSEIYKKYTAERETHVIFTKEIKRLTDSIVGSEQNPYLKVVRIFDYIAQNYPWASAREYSTIRNIPQYVIENKHGDCGQQSLLFITMARYAGIPAKWQSGWMMHPGEENLHDWAEAYFHGIGWVPVDQSFGHVYQAGLLQDAAQANDKVYHYFTRGLDAYRYIVNDDFSGRFYPAKTYPRSETVDFQRGEVETLHENLYFGRWRYKMEIE